MAKSLLSQAKQFKPEKHKLNWFTRLTPAQQSEITELLDSFINGQLEGDWDCRELYRRIIQPNGFNVSESVFRGFVKEYREKKVTSGTSLSPATKRRKERTRG